MEIVYFERFSPSAKFLNSPNKILCNFELYQKLLNCVNKADEMKLWIIPNALKLLHKRTFWKVCIKFGSKHLTDHKKLKEETTGDNK